MNEAPEEVRSEQYLATLVRGEVHYLRDIRFDHGIPTVVEAHHKDHLEEHAVDVVGDQDGETMVKDKFAFTPYSGHLEVGTPTRLSDAVRGDRDAGTTARLCAFGEKEAARLARISKETPKFDKEAARAEIETTPTAQAEDGGEVTSAPRARPRPPAPAPFDADARRAEVAARSRKATDEDPSLPRARPPRFSASRATA